jgi:outer membrane protein OmpA-like peptidoglycan-associated protein
MHPQDPTQVPAPVPQLGSPIQPRRKSRRGLAIAIVFGILFSLLAGFGALSYLVVRKVESAYMSFKAELTGQQPEVTRPPAKPMAENQPCPDVDSAEIADLRKAQAASLIPLIPNLTVDNVWVVDGKDLEYQDQIKAVQDRQVVTQNFGDGVHWENSKLVVSTAQSYPSRSVCQSDLLSAHIVVTQARKGIPEVLLHTTTFSVSRELYDVLKNNRRAPFKYRQDYHPVGNGYSWNTDLDGYIQPLLGGSPTFRTLVNGEEKDLPVLRGISSAGVPGISLVVLDDAGNPLLLEFQCPQLNFSLHVAKISFPGGKKIETDLQKSGRSEVYGLYFDFDSATIRAASEPVLTEIADALKQNPDWKLSIEGHTDNIGGDAHNLDLSQRRAEAVKKALVDRYAISADRLSTAGFGASRPKATNDTIEGRARNRRVELVKQ